MPDIITQEFYDQFEGTRYPFADTATLTDTTGTLTLPKSIFLDASLYLPGATRNLYISSIEITLNAATITISEDGGSCTASAVIRNVESDGAVPVTNSVGQIVGCLVSDISRLSFFQSQPVGLYTFSANATSFTARCIFPDPGTGVSAIQNGTTALSGDVWLVGGDGVYLSADGGTIRIDIAGDVLYQRAASDSVEGQGYVTENYLRTINGVAPDMYGNINIGQIYNPQASALRVITTSTGTTIKQI